MNANPNNFRKLRRSNPLYLLAVAVTFAVPLLAKTEPIQLKVELLKPDGH